MSINVTLKTLGPPSNSATPTFSALVSDPSLQVKARFTVYQSDGTTKIGTVDSNYIVGSGIVQATFNTALPLGTYKVGATAINTNGEQSAETSPLLTFYVATPVVKSLTALWDAQSLFTVVQKNQTFIWNTLEDNAKTLILNWLTNENVIKTLGLKWNVNPTWQ